MKKKGNVSKQEGENTQELAKGKNHAGCGCSATEEHSAGMCRAPASLLWNKHKYLLGAEDNSQLQGWDGA